MPIPHSAFRGPISSSPRRAGELDGRTESAPGRGRRGRKPGARPLRRLRALGQSVWLDSMRRDLYTTGELARLIREDGVRGMTSNPTIFQKAIVGSGLYDAQIESGARWGLGPSAIFQSLAVEDVRRAADESDPFTRRPAGTTDSCRSRFGLTSPTTRKARSRKRAGSGRKRPLNVMVKIPATDEGLEATRRCRRKGSTSTSRSSFPRRATATSWRLSCRARGACRRRQSRGASPVCGQLLRQPCGYPHRRGARPHRGTG